MLQQVQQGLLVEAQLPPSNWTSLRALATLETMGTVSKLSLVQPGRNCVVPGHALRPEFGLEIADQSDLRAFKRDDQSLYGGCQRPLLQQDQQLARQPFSFSGLRGGELDAPFQRLEGQPGG
jgi:hypothetical protein